MFHVTWGAGLCTKYMLSICPKARPFGVSKIHSITTNEYDNPLRRAGLELNVAIWHLTQDCVDDLDQYENALNGLIVRASTTIKANGIEFPARIHLIPSIESANTIFNWHFDLYRRGYDEWGFPHSALDRTMELLERAA